MIITTDEHLCGFQHSLKADKWLETVGNGLDCVGIHSTAASEPSEEFPRDAEKKAFEGKKEIYNHLLCKEGL